MERNFIDGYTEWQSNPEIVGVNKLPQHATFMPYENFDEAKKADRFSSSRMKLLNGNSNFIKIMLTGRAILPNLIMIRIIGIQLKCRVLGKCRDMTKHNTAMFATLGREARIFVRLMHLPSIIR